MSNEYDFWTYRFIIKGDFIKLRQNLILVQTKFFQNAIFDNTLEPLSSKRTKSWV